MTPAKTWQYFAIIPAAGTGSRMSSGTPKQYLTLNGKTLLEHAINALLTFSAIEKIVVVLHPHDHYWSNIPLSKHSKIIATYGGGAERCHSVSAGLEALKPFACEHDWVIVHDAARPYLQAPDLEKLIYATKDHPVGGLLGVPVHDTLKRTDEQGNVKQTVARAHLWHAFTPQIFRFGLLCRAFAQALTEQPIVTDEASAIELLGLQPLMVQGRSDNIKITVPEDLK